MKMKFLIYLTVFILINTTYKISKAQNYCDICLKTCIELKSRRVALDDAQYVTVNFEIINCSDSILRVLTPFVGPSEDFNHPYTFVDINLVVYKSDKNYSSQNRINIQPGDIHGFKKEYIEINPSGVHCVKVSVYPYYLSKLEEGNYIIKGFYKLKTTHGFLTIPSNEIEMEIY